MMFSQQSNKYNHTQNIHVLIVHLTYCDIVDPKLTLVDIVPSWFLSNMAKASLQALSSSGASLSTMFADFFGL